MELMVYGWIYRHVIIKLMENLGNPAASFLTFGMIVYRQFHDPLIDSVSDFWRNVQV